MLKARLATGLVLIVALVLSVLLLSAQSLALLFAVVLVVAAWEWTNLSEVRSLPARCVVIAVFLVVLFLSRYQLSVTLAVACAWWWLAFLLVVFYPRSQSLLSSRTVRLCMGLLVLVPPWLALMFLREQGNGIALLFSLVLLVSCADTGAYFAGKRWGQAKLIPAVSPGKSWAGFWGGNAVALAVAFLFWRLQLSDYVNLLPYLALALATVWASVLGDLFESMMKRHRGIKDSGNLLPGHGGFLDRLDSITAAAPVYAAGLVVIG